MKKRVSSPSKPVLYFAPRNFTINNQYEMPYTTDSNSFNSGFDMNVRKSKENGKIRSARKSSEEAKHNSNSVKKRGKRKVIVKRKFTDEEDAALINLIDEHGENNWKLIARNMPSDRTPRQCRERWKYYLSGFTNNDKWSQEEDQLLLEKYQFYGPRWAKIAKYFQDKNDINLKNRFNQLKRNEIRMSHLKYDEPLANCSPALSLDHQIPIMNYESLPGSQPIHPHNSCLLFQRFPPNTNALSWNAEADDEYEANSVDFNSPREYLNRNTSYNKNTLPHILHPTNYLNIEKPNCSYGISRIQNRPLQHNLSFNEMNLNTILCSPINYEKGCSSSSNLSAPSGTPENQNQQNVMTISNMLVNDEKIHQAKRLKPMTVSFSASKSSSGNKENSENKKQKPSHQYIELPVPISLLSD